MMDKSKVAPLPWRVEQFEESQSHCIVDNDSRVVIPLSAMAEKEDLDYIVECCNEYGLAKETCKKLIDQDTQHYETIAYYENINEILRGANDILLDEGQKLKTKLRIAITFIKRLDTEEGNSILELLRDGIKLE